MKYICGIFATNKKHMRSDVTGNCVVCGVELDSEDQALNDAV